MKRGPIFVLIGALCFSTTGTTCALCMPDAGSFSIAFMRSVLMATLFILLVTCRRLWREFLPISYWVHTKPLIAFSSIAIYQLFFFAALQFAGVTVATVVTIGSVPICVGIASALIFKRPPDRMWYLATSMAIFGIICLGLSKGFGDASAIGVIFAILAGASYGNFVIFSPYVKRNSEIVLTVMFIFSVILVGILSFFTCTLSEFIWFFTPFGALGGIILGLVGMVAYLFTITGFKETPSPIAATLSLAEPLGATILGIFLLGEEMTSLSIIGIVLLFISMAIPILSISKK